jgi:hypothetical protein
VVSGAVSHAASRRRPANSPMHFRTISCDLLVIGALPAPAIACRDTQQIRALVPLVCPIKRLKPISYK